MIGMKFDLLNFQLVENLWGENFLLLEKDVFAESLGMFCIVGYV